MLDYETLSRLLVILHEAGTYHRIGLTLTLSRRSTGKSNMGFSYFIVDLVVSDQAAICTQVTSRRPCYTRPSIAHNARFNGPASESVQYLTLRRDHSIVVFQHPREEQSSRL